MPGDERVDAGTAVEAPSAAVPAPARPGSYEVVVGVDGEQPSFLAEEAVRAVADRGRCHLTVVCSNTFDMSLHQSEVQGLGRYAPEAGAAHAAALVDAAVGRFADAGFRATGVVREGDALGALLGAVQAAGASLLAIGSGRGSWAGIPLLGHVAGRLLAECPSSVLVVRTWVPPAGGDHVPVLVATDGSVGAQDAVAAFAAFADPARCGVVVAGVARASVLERWGPVPPGSDAGLEDHHAERNVAAAAALLEERGVPCTTTVTHGRTAEALLQLAEREGCRLVVAGSRGLGHMRGLALGSVSDKVARYAPAAFVGRA